MRHFGDRYIEEVHDRAYLAYLKRACALVPEGKSVYPYVFPIRNAARPPRDLPLRAGYYCIDTFTPLNSNAYKAARGAVDCALTCAEEVVGGYHLAYAVVRPPGHHAERRSFGGFCYFNSAGVAAQYLSRYGRVALLDVDYHHGNGAEDIFYGRDDVLTLSLHGHPRHTYPYFSGFEEDNGAGAAEGFNLNFPMPEGLDPAKGDPTGSFTLGAKDFRENGKMIGALKLPTLVVQEGGYRTRSLGVNARNFFDGLWEAAHDSES